MVKHKIRRKAERAARAGGAGGEGTTRDAREEAETAADADADAAMASLTSSHRRKVKKRAKFLEKIRVATETKMKKTSNARGKGTMADMRALSMSLAEVVGDGGVGLATTAKRSKTPTARRRAALVSKETTRMQAVLSHPTFRSNPIAAISNHIISDVANASGSAASGRSSEDKGKKKRAKKLTPRQERDRSGAHVVGPAAPSARRRAHDAQRKHDEKKRGRA